jgi:DNA polymerase
MKRGAGREIFIIGIAPGNTELKSARAFSGNSGKRLDQWLVASGRPCGDPRSGVYLTSLLKCAPPHNAPRDFRKMAANCRHFLDEQLNLVKPRLVITLGKESFEYLRLAPGEYDGQIGILQVVPATGLIVPQPYSALIHWPHPSGLSRWHNDAANLSRLNKSFSDIKQFLEEAP